MLIDIYRSLLVTRCLHLRGYSKDVGSRLLRNIAKFPHTTRHRIPKDKHVAWSSLWELQVSPVISRCDFTLRWCV